MYVAVIEHSDLIQVKRSWECLAYNLTIQMSQLLCLRLP